MAYKPPKIPKTAHRFDIPLYGGELVLCCNREDVESVLLAYKVSKQLWDIDGLNTVAGAARHFVSDSGGSLYLVYVGDLMLRTLVHELMHTTFFIADYVGLDSDTGSRESLCYLHDWMFQRTYGIVMEEWQRVEDLNNDAG